jgi:thiol:disulfide interchange protein DsbC
MILIRIAAFSLGLGLAQAPLVAEVDLLPAAPSAGARAPDPAPDTAEAIPKATEDAIRARILQRVPGKLMSLRSTGFGLYEAVIDSEIVYVDEAVNYVFAGHVYDTRSHQDLTAKRSEEVLRVDFSSLPLQLAFKIVRGDGSRPVAIFEDPNCPYCKRLERDIRTLQNTTMYIFLYPILSDDSVAK